MVLRHSILYLAARLAQSAAMFAALSLLTRLLTPAEYGHYALVTSSVAMVSAVIGQWLYSSVLRLAPAAPDERRFVSTIVITYGGVLGATAVIGAAVLPFVQDPVLRPLLIIGFGLLCATGFVDLNLSLLAARMQSERYALVSVARAVGVALLGVGLAYAGLGAPGALAGSIAGGLLAGAVLLRGDWRRISPGRFDRRMFREVLAYGLPLSGGFVFYAVLAYSDRLLLAALSDARTVGLYTAAFDLTDKIIMALMMSVANATYPRAVQQLERAGAAAAVAQSRRNFTLLLGAGLPAAVGIAMVSDDLAALAMGAEFRAAAGQIIPLAAAASFLNNLRSHYFDHAFQLGRRTGGLIAVTAIGAALAVGLCLLWIPAHGALGAVWAAVVAYGVSLAACVVLGRSAFAMPLPGYETAVIAGATALMALVVYLVPDRGDLVALVLRIVAGLLTYAAIVGLLLPELRGAVRARWRQRRATPPLALREP